MSTKTRIANKTQWSLQDIIALVAKARRSYCIARDRNEQKYMDQIMTIELSRVGDALNDIDRIARLAQNGEYEGGVRLVTGDGD